MTTESDKQFVEAVTRFRSRISMSDSNGMVRSFDAETIRLAQMVADMPPLPTDEKSIEEWAKQLAADIHNSRIK